MIRVRSDLLRTQLFTWLLIPLLALLVVDAFVSYGIAVRFAQGAYDRSLVEIAREVGLHVRVAKGTPVLDMPEPARRILLEDASDILYFELTDASGQNFGGGQIARPPAGAVHESNGAILYDGVVDHNNVRIVEVRLDAPSDGAVAGVIVRVAETRVKRNELAHEILGSVVVPQILLIILASGLVWFGVLRGLAPLGHLQRAIAMRSHRDRSPIEEAGVPGEVKPIVMSINALLARLDNVLTLQSRFIADAAHQLKTPVAGLKAQVELMLRETDPAALREVSARLYVAVERLSRLVSQLLSLARNEPDAIRSVVLQPVDVNALALEIATMWVPQALKQRIDLGFEGCERPVIISGDAGRLRELFDNLLDNAIRYSCEGGSVTVRVSDTPRPAVSIGDDGPSIPENERRRVFERFHRLLGAPSEGSGLGLAIAREIAELHNADIVLRDDDTDGIGNIFSVIFPEPSQPPTTL